MRGERRRFQEIKLLGLTRVNHDLADLNPDSRHWKEKSVTGIRKRTQKLATPTDSGPLQK